MNQNENMCCYQSLPDQDGRTSPCQFDKDTKRLISVGGYTFCPLHLPFSEDDLREKYGKPNEDNPRGYKAYWTEEQKSEFNADIHSRLIEAKKTSQTTWDLTGVEFPATFNEGAREYPSVSFEDCHFARGANFRGASFTDNIARFKNAKFSGNKANFFDLRMYGGSLHFERARFIGVDANFGASGVLKDGENTNTYAIRVAEFDETIFSAHAKFINRHFHNRTNFENATFQTAPRFHGCELHQDTTFPPIENFKDTKGRAASHAYRTLRLAMKQQEAHEEEAMFWALEQRSKRHQLGEDLKRNWFPWALSWGYDALSNYGLDAGLPARWLAVWVVYSTLIYAGISGTIEKLSALDHWLGALTFSFAQMARPFFIWGDYDNANIKAALGSDEFSFLIKVLATVDSLVSLTLIALLILAVRRRFRMQ